MTDGPKRRRTDGWLVRPIKLSFIILTVVFFLVLGGFAWVVHDVKTNSGHIRVLLVQNASLAHENSDRITDIQQSRIESCERTYEGIREVFRPFFPKHPTNQRQIDNVETFNTTINNLKKACTKQTKPKSNKPIPKKGGQ